MFFYTKWKNVDLYDYIDTPVGGVLVNKSLKVP